jgi:hypothetical protein
MIQLQSIQLHDRRRLILAMGSLLLTVVSVLVWHQYQRHLRSEDYRLLNIAQDDTAFELSLPGRLG